MLIVLRSLASRIVPPSASALPQCHSIKSVSRLSLSRPWSVVADQNGAPAPLTPAVAAPKSAVSTSRIIIPQFRPPEQCRVLALGRLVPHRVLPAGNGVAGHHVAQASQEVSADSPPDGMDAARDRPARSKPVSSFLMSLSLIALFGTQSQECAVYQSSS